MTQKMSKTDPDEGQGGEILQNKSEVCDANEELNGMSVTVQDDKLSSVSEEPVPAQPDEVSSTTEPLDPHTKEEQRTRDGFSDVQEMYTEVVDSSTDTSLNSQDKDKNESSTVPKCEVCVNNPSKYTCPRCSVRTCSLPCVKEHKARLDCSGERDKTAFVPLEKYGDMHLLNDYRFLEDAERTLFSNKLSNSKKNQRQDSRSPYHFHFLSRRSKLLMTAAHKRGVLLRMVPQAMTKNKVNSSFYTVSTDSIEWHIDWNFVASNTILKDCKVPEKNRLLDVAQKFTNFVEFPHLRKPLEDYKKEKLKDCKFLLKVEGLPANVQRFFSLNPQCSIADNMRGHCLTEYPTIYVLPDNHSTEDYKILCKDDIPVMRRENARHLVQYHREYDIVPEMQAQLLNPKSEIYATSS